MDYAAITRRMAVDIIQACGQILCSAAVTAIQNLGDTWLVSTADTTHRFDQLIVCAGLQSDAIARMVGASSSPKIFAFRGVHFTRGVNGEVHVGPNAVPALPREGYSWTSISVKDTVESLRWPGAPRLAKKYWKMGLAEIGASLAKPLYLKQAQAYLPELSSADLVAKGKDGVRAQAGDKDGSLIDDFAVDRVGPRTLLRNAPPPLQQPRPWPLPNTCWSTSPSTGAANRTIPLSELSWGTGHPKYSRFRSSAISPRPTVHHLVNRCGHSLAVPAESSWFQDRPWGIQ